MNDVTGIDDNDANLEEKLNAIARAIAAEQKKVQAKINGIKIDESAIIDPQDELLCEGCQ